MDPRLLSYYNRELAFMREMGGEFAKEFPKIAGRLGLDGFECADPYVERLLEGFAFLAARVQLKIDAEFPRFTQHLLEMVYPHYLAPTPAMAVVQFTPDLAGGPLNDGFRIPRGSVLRSPLAKGEQTACEFRTAHDVTLWPIALSDARYQTYAREMGGADTPAGRSARTALRLRLKGLSGAGLETLSMDRLSLFLRGGELAVRLYEGLLANATGVVVRAGQGAGGVQEMLGREAIRRVGFEPSEALLPHGPRSFQGYRLLQEYFAFPERFLFVEIAGLAPAIRRCSDGAIEIVVLMDRADPALLNAVDATHFGLFCTPAINLFPRRCDPIPLEERHTEYHVVPDRTVPLDLEIHQVTQVVGAGAGGEGEREFLPFYARARGRSAAPGEAAFYTVRRAPYVPSQRAREKGPRSSYVGGEVFLSLVDASEAPVRTGLRHLNVTALCTNRDLTLQMAPGQGRTDFTLQTSAPVASIRCVSGPSRPWPSKPEGETAWRLISSLSLNYLSLADNDPGEGAAALREMLMLYGGDMEAAMRIQVEGVRSVRSTPITRVLSTATGPAMGRGLQVEVLFDEGSFAGSGAYLLGSVLERFFARYVSINSFTETVLKSQTRGEFARWPARTGNREIL